MAKIEWVDARLVEWGAWWRAGGRVDCGYPVRNILHPDWGRPGQGAMPSLKIVHQGRGAETHECLRGASVKVQAMLVLVYGRCLSVQATAQTLGVAAPTVQSRMWSAHAALARVLRR